MPAQDFILGYSRPSLKGLVGLYVAIAVIYGIPHLRSPILGGRCGRLLSLELVLQRWTSGELLQVHAQLVGLSMGQQLIPGHFVPGIAGHAAEHAAECGLDP